MKRCVLFGGGAVSDDGYVRRLLKPEDFIICADSGYRHARRLGVRPHILAGDFDSYLEEKPEGCRVVSADAHKDETDTLLSVRLGLAEGCREFVLLGMTDGRLDHTLANLQTLRFLEEKGVPAAAMDASVEMYVVKDRTLTVGKKAGYSLSVFSLDAVSRGVTLENVAYPLKDYEMSASFPIGVSNAFLEGDARVSVTQGCLAVLVCRLDGEAEG